MREKRAKYDKGVRGGAVVLVLAAATGCSAGQGSPDGWRYQRHGPVAVALPKTWRATAGGALLRGPDGRTDAALSLATTAHTATTATTATTANTGNPATATAPDGSAPAGVRRQTLTLDGRQARVAYFARPAADGRPADHVEVRVDAPDGSPLTLRAWIHHATTRDPALLTEIVNSIEFPRAGS